LITYPSLEHKETGIT